MAEETGDEDQRIEVLGADEIRNRLAAAEFDIIAITRHMHDGSHPNLMET